MFKLLVRHMRLYNAQWQPAFNLKLAMTYLAGLEPVMVGGAAAAYQLGYHVAQCASVTAGAALRLFVEGALGAGGRAAVSHSLIYELTSTQEPVTESSASLQDHMKGMGELVCPLESWSASAIMTVAGLRGAYIVLDELGHIVRVGIAVNPVVGLQLGDEVILAGSAEGLAGFGDTVTPATGRGIGAVGQLPNRLDWLASFHKAPPSQ